MTLIPVLYAKCGCAYEVIPVATDENGPLWLRRWRTCKSHTKEAPSAD